MTSCTSPYTHTGIASNTTLINHPTIFSDQDCSNVIYAPDKCSFVKAHCTDENLGLFNYLETYYCAHSFSFSMSYMLLVFLWLGTLFMAIGIAASDYLCPNLNTISKMLGLSESLAGVTFLAFGNGSPDVFSTYAAMKIGSGSLAIGELVGAASFITAVVAGSMAIIRPFKVARRSFTRDILFFTVAVCFSMYFMSDGILTVGECYAMLAIYSAYVVFVVGWHWYNTTKRRNYLIETRARDFYTEAGHESRIEEDEEIRDEASILTNGLDMSALTASLEEDHMLSPHSLRLSKTATPRGSVSTYPLSPRWQDESEEEEQEEVYTELTRNMRLRSQTASHQALSPGSMGMGSGTTAHAQRIRPSLFGALEFRDVLQQLQDSKSSHSNIIPLTPRLHPAVSTESSQSLSQSLPSNTDSFLQTRLQLDPNPNERRASEVGSPWGAQDLQWQQAPVPNKTAHKALPKLDIPQLIVTQSDSEIVSPRLDSNHEIVSPQVDLLSSNEDNYFNFKPSPTTEIVSPRSGTSPSSTSFPHQLPRHSVSNTSSSASSIHYDTKQPSWPARIFRRLPVLTRYQPFFETLFPSLTGLTHKSWINVVTSLVSAPAIFLFNITVPVIEVDPIDKEVTQSRHNSTSPVERYRDDPEHVSSSPGSPTADNDTPFQDVLTPYTREQYIPIKRWLLVTQSVFGPLFAVLSNTDTTLFRALLSAALASLTLLALVHTFVTHPSRAPPSVQLISLAGFLFAIAWISVVANEVVAVLKALGTILRVSDAVLGLTVFAVGNSLGDLVANTTVAKMGFPMMALSACFGGPMLNILVGIGVSGLLVMPAHGTYTVEISHTLVISAITLLATLLFLLVSIPLNKWEMSRTIGIVAVAFWVLSTGLNVIIEIVWQK